MKLNGLIARRSLERHQMIIRDAKKEDCLNILTLNEKNVEMLLPMDCQQFMYFIEKSELFKVAEIDGNIVAFLIALRSKVDYNLQVYQWFLQRYSNFIYIDRVVIDEAYRRMGIARKLYECMFDHSYRQGITTITSGIEVEPNYNKASIEFHNSMGFEEVGKQYVRSGTVNVSLLVKEMVEKMWDEIPTPKKKGKQ